MVSSAVPADLSGSSLPGMDPARVRGGFRLRRALLPAGAVLGGDAPDRPLGILLHAHGLCYREPGKDVGGDLPGDRCGNGDDSAEPSSPGPLLVEALSSQAGFGNQKGGTDREHVLGTTSPSRAFPGPLHGDPDRRGGCPPIYFRKSGDERRKRREPFGEGGAGSSSTRRSFGTGRYRKGAFDSRGGGGSPRDAEGGPRHRHRLGPEARSLRLSGAQHISGQLGQ